MAVMGPSIVATLGDSSAMAVSASSIVAVAIGSPPQLKRANLQAKPPTGEIPLVS